MEVNRLTIGQRNIKCLTVEQFKRLEELIKAESPGMVNVIDWIPVDEELFYLYWVEFAVGCPTKTILVYGAKEAFFRHRLRVIPRGVMREVVVGATTIHVMKQYFPNQGVPFGDLQDLTPDVIPAGLDVHVRYHPGDCWGIGPAKSVSVYGRWQGRGDLGVVDLREYAGPLLDAVREEADHIEFFRESDMSNPYGGAVFEDRIGKGR